VIQILPQGGFAGELAIIPPNGEPGIIIQAVDRPGSPVPGLVGPVPRPGVPTLPVNPVSLIVPAPIVPAPLDPLAHWIGNFWRRNAQQPVQKGRKTSLCTKKLLDDVIKLTLTFLAVDLHISIQISLTFCANKQ
jgi:hypothetical protein